MGVNEPVCCPFCCPMAPDAQAGDARAFLKLRRRRKLPACGWKKSVVPEARRLDSFKYKCSPVDGESTISRPATNPANPASPIQDLPCAPTTPTVSLVLNRVRLTGLSVPCLSFNTPIEPTPPRHPHSAFPSRLLILFDRQGQACLSVAAAIFFTLSNRHHPASLAKSIAAIQSPQQT